MRKIKIILTSLMFFLVVSCSSNSAPLLGGSYISERVEGYVIQIAIQPEENTFVQYIDNREVDRGVFEKQSENTYLFKGDKQEFETTLTSEDSFEVSVAQINDGKLIELINESKVPAYFSTEFDDVDEYEELLNKK